MGLSLGVSVAAGALAAGDEFRAIGGLILGNHIDFIALRATTASFFLPSLVIDPQGVLLKWFFLLLLFFHF